MLDLPLGFASPDETSALLLACSADVAVLGGLMYCGERELVIRVAPEAGATLLQHRLWSVRLDHADPMVTQIDSIRRRDELFEICLTICPELGSHQRALATSRRRLAV